MVEQGVGGFEISRRERGSEEFPEERTVGSGREAKEDRHGGEEEQQYSEQVSCLGRHRKSDKTEEHNVGKGEGGGGRMERCVPLNNELWIDEHVCKHCKVWMSGHGLT